MRKNWILTVGSMALVASILTITSTPAQDRLPTVLKSKKALDEPFERLPATEPAVEFAPPEARETDHDVVLFAAGALELTLPVGWQVREVAVGREMRLVTIPTPSGNLPSRTFDGVWFAYHVSPRDVEPTANEIATFLATRMNQLIGSRGTPSAVKTSTVQGWPGARQEFVIPASVNNPGGSRGFHVVVGTKWGFCEIHSESPTANLAQRNGEIQQLLRTLVLDEPQDRQVPTLAETQVAAAALGTWKAFRSRMKIFGDGRILLIQDAALDQPLDQIADANGGDKFRLRGRFEARQDVLMVTWADGTKQNYRWRVHANGLLLTDHQGQTNHLKKIYE